MRNTSVTLGLLGLLALVSTTARAEDEKFKRLSMDEVQAMIQAGSANVYDNNNHDRYVKGHVPTAKWLDIENVTAANFPVEKTRALIFYCGNTHCMACHEGANAAIALGYTNVYIMPDGIAGWEKAGRPVEK